MIICFETADADKVKDYIDRIREKISSQAIGVIFKSVDYEFFILRSEPFNFLFILRVDYVLPNIVPKRFLANRIIKSLRVKGGVSASLIKPVAALNVLLDYRCGDGL